MIHNQWKIRLLGGILHGREIVLPETGLTLGERGCDVYLPLKEAVKLILRIKAGKLYIDAGNASIRVNGHRHRKDIALPPIGILKTAGITIAFGSKEDCLAEIVLPTRYSILFYVVILSLILLVFISNKFWIKSSLSESIKDIPGQVEKILKKSGINEDNLSLTWTQDGILTLSGYCSEGAKMRTISQELVSLGIFFRDRVVREDILIRDIQELLQQAGYANATVRSIAPGEISIEGDITMGYRWASVLPHLLQMPGLKRWHIENRQEMQSKAIVLALKESKLAEKLSMISLENKFTLSGLLDEHSKNCLDKLLVHLRAQFPDLVINYQAIPISSDDGERYLPSPAVGVIHGRHGIYLLLKNGSRLKVGSRLPGGNEIVALTDHAIAIHCRNALINYPFNF